MDDDGFVDLPDEPWKYGIIDDRALYPHRRSRLPRAASESASEAAPDAPGAVSETRDAP